MVNYSKQKFFSFLIIIMTAFTVAPAVSTAASIDTPTTGFEDSGGKEWTTLEEEKEFIEEIEEKSDRVSISEIGSSVNGNSINLIKVGYPNAPTDAEIEDGRNILIMGTPHGNEPAARDLSFKLLRELAFTDDEERLELLEKSTILLLPTPNPDGRDANVRTNAWGLDNNRDNLNLKTPENQAIAGILEQYKPDVVVDAHERPTGTTPDVEMLWPRNLNVDEELYDLNVEMVKQYIMPDVIEDGFTAGVYGSPTGAGSGDERILRNLGALRHSLTLLTESAGAVEKADRVDMQESIINSALNFYAERFDEIGKVVSEAPERKKAEGKAGDKPFYLEGRDDNEDTIRTMDPPSCGYLLHADQAEKIEKQIELFGIETEEVSKNGVYISMDQPMMTVIPLLVDKRATYNEVDAVALEDCTDIGSIAPSYTPSKDADLKTLEVNLDGDNQIEFDADKNEYSLETTEEKAVIRSTTNHKHAEIELNGSYFLENRTVELDKGENKFDLVVTAENGDEQTYTVVINRTDAPTFSDIDGHWAEDYVLEAHNNGWIKGYSDGTFKPDNHLTRIQTASLFTRVLDLEEREPVSFKDIKGIGDSTLEELEAAYAANIIRGYGDNTFKPYKDISRAHIALMISRVYEQAAGEAYEVDKETSFPDIGHYDQETQDAILMLKELGIVDGENGKFKPDDTTTRAHAAKMLINLEEVLEDL